MTRDCTVFHNIDKIRNAKGITKTFMSEKLGYETVMGYQHLRSGDIKSNHIIICANILGVEPSVFFSNELTNSVINQLTTKISEKGYTQSVV